MVCWACGPQNRVEMLSMLTGLSKTECWKLFGEQEWDKFDVRPTGKYIPPNGLGELKKRHKDYIRARGLNLREVVRLWRPTGFSGTAPAGFAWRIFIPVFLREKPVSWTTRATSSDVKCRYMSAPSYAEAVAAKSLLYGEDYADNAIVVLEGPLDVWRVGPGAVCTLGVNFTRAQVARMAAYPRRVVCMDNTPDGRRKSRELCALLSPFDGETLEVTLDAKDAGEASEKEIRQLRRLL